MKTVFFTLDWGSIVDWISELFTILSKNLKFFLQSQHDKPNLHFELVNWPVEYYEDFKNKFRDSFFLLVQNEEPNFLNIKIKSYNIGQKKLMYDNKIVRLPSINDSNRLIFLDIPIEPINGAKMTFTFQSLANNKIAKISIKWSNNLPVLYHSGKQQFINKNLRKQDVKLIHL